MDDSKSRIGQPVEVFARSITGAVVPDHDLLRLLGGLGHNTKKEAAEQMEPVVSQDDDGDHVLGPSSCRDRTTSNVQSSISSLATVSRTAASHSVRTSC